MERIYIPPRQIVKATVIVYATVTLLNLAARKLSRVVKGNDAWIEATETS